MKKLYLLSLFYLCSVPLSAQKSLISEGVESITIAELRDHMFYLASDELEGRQSGTIGYDKAAQYVVTQLRQAGLSPVCKNEDSTLSYYQELFIDKYSPGPNNIVTIIKDSDRRTYTYEDNFIIGYGGPFETKELSGRLVYVGAGIREPEYGIDDYKNVDVRGKWVVMLENIPVNLKHKLPQKIYQKYLYFPENRKILVQQAKDKGAIGIIIIPNDYHFKNWKGVAEQYHDFYTISKTGQLLINTELPSLLIDPSMIEFLFAGQKYDPLKDYKSCKSFELKNCEFTLSKEYTISTINTVNAIGLIEGSDPVLKNEYITLCAHLDHMGIQHGEVMNGADDNASGSVGVLEIAEALAMSKPERSVICVLFGGEELFLLGSYYFTEDPPVPIKNIIGNINLDMIGCSDTDIKALAPIGAGRITPKLKEVISKVSKRTQYVAIDWAYADTSRYVNMSDHYPFYLKKIPAVFFFSGDNADIHMPTDDAEKIDYDFFQKSCQLVYEIVMELANGNVGPRD
jgi:hypothetical protein